MTKEQEAIERLNSLIKVNKDFFENQGDMLIDKRDIQALETVLSMLKEKDSDIEKVLELIFQYGQIDGDHHKAWVIDQIVRILTGDKYKEWVKEYTYDEETGECYSWNKGIAP